MKLKYFIVVFIFISSCKKAPIHLSKITADTIAVDSTIVSNVEIDSIIVPYKKKLTSKIQHVLSYTSKMLVKDDESMQSSLGNLMADACFSEANLMVRQTTNNTIDFAMFNHGGMRAPIPEGEITVEHIFKLMPFENELVVVTLSGKKVIELVNYFIKNKKAHPLSNTIQLAISSNNYDLKINGESFDENRTYTVLTSDYLQNGGDKMDFFKQPEKLVKLDLKVRDAIIEYLKKVDTLKVELDKRVIIE